MRRKILFMTVLAAAMLCISAAWADNIWEATLTWEPADNSEHANPPTGWNLYYDTDRIAATPLTGTGATQGNSPIALMDPEATTAVISGLPDDQVICFGISVIGPVAADESYPRIACANFMGDEIFTVRASASTGGTISPAGPVAVASGDNQLFTVIPNADHERTGLFLDGTNVEGDVFGNEYTLVGTDRNCTLNASYRSTGDHTVTTTSTGTGGSVSSSTSTVQDGGHVVINVNPVPGHYLSGFFCDGYDVLADVSNGKYTSDPIYNDTTITAEFSEIPVHPVYRLNSASGHFFTASVAEKDALVGMGWNLEGVAWYSPTQNHPGLMPVYRLNNAHGHFFTAGEAEKNALVAAGWNLEGVAWYSPSYQTDGQNNVYRLNHPISGHFFTAGEAEKNALVGMGWNLEGVGWWAK